MFTRGKKGISSVVTTVLLILVVVAAIAVISILIINLVGNLNKGNGSSAACQKLEATPIECIYNNTDTYSKFSIQPGVNLVNLTMVYEKETGSPVFKTIIGSDLENLTTTSLLFNDSANVQNPPKAFSILPIVSVDNVLYTCPQSRKINCVLPVISGNASGNPITGGNVGFITNGTSPNTGVRASGGGGGGSSGGGSGSCTSECSVNALDECSGTGVRTCGNYDSDSCLEWSGVTSCNSNEICLSGTCSKRPVLELLFEDGNNRAKDSSGYGNNGTIFNTVNFASASNNYYANFASSGGYIRIPSSASLNTEETTFSFWAKRDSQYALGTWNTVIYKGGEPNNAYGPYEIVLSFLKRSNGELNIDHRTTILAASDSSWVNPSSYVYAWENISGRMTEDGTWHMITVVRGGNFFRYYVDGVLVVDDSFAANITDFYNANNYLYIGTDSYRHSLGASLDNVRIFNNTLTSNQVLSMYNSEKSVFTGSGNSSSGGNNNLVLAPTSFIASYNSQMPSFDFTWNDNANNEVGTPIKPVSCVNVYGYNDCASACGIPSVSIDVLSGGTQTIGTGARSATYDFSANPAFQNCYNHSSSITFEIKAYNSQGQSSIPQTFSLVKSMSSANGYLLTVSPSGTGSGSLSVFPGITQCTQGTCSVYVYKNSGVSITATEQEGSTLTSWIGCIPDVSNPLTCRSGQITSDKSISAVFSLISGDTPTSLRVSSYQNLDSYNARITLAWSDNLVNEQWYYLHVYGEDQTGQLCNDEVYLAGPNAETYSVDLPRYLEQNPGYDQNNFCDYTFKIQGVRSDSSQTAFSNNVSISTSP